MLDSLRPLRMKPEMSWGTGEGLEGCWWTWWSSGVCEKLSAFLGPQGLKSRDLERGWREEGRNGMK